MKFLFAPDSFKGSISALEAAQMLDEAARRHFPEAATLLLPVADGGEGTVEALITAVGGSYQHLQVTGPLGQPVQASYGLLSDGKTAVLEMAQASGLPLVPSTARDPRNTSSYGTGEMIAAALDSGISKLLLGIGGSATNDGGMGMLQALGIAFYDAQNNPLPGKGSSLGQVHHLDMTQLHPRLKEVSITVICDVTNPLLGPNGATYIYGPQKGATPAICVELEEGMTHYAQTLSSALGRDIASFPGAGAAGGVGAALGGVLNATLRSGIDAILDAVHFETLLQGVDLVITGEGRIDEQSIRYGKVPAGIAKRCGIQNIPVIALVGGMDKGAQDLYPLTPSSIFTTTNGPMDLDHAMANAHALFADAADRLFRILRLGQGLGR